MLTYRQLQGMIGSNILIVLISFSTIFWHTLYDVEVRSSIIGQIFDPVAETLDQVDISNYPIYDLDRDAIEDELSIIQRAQVLYADQKQVCLNFFQDGNVVVGDMALVYKGHFIHSPMLFSCMMSAINDGQGAGLISRQSLQTYFKMNRSKKGKIEEAYGLYFEGGAAAKFQTKIGKSIEYSNWHGFIIRKFEPWEEELNMKIQRFHSSGIPDFFLSDDNILRNNPNPHSREEKDGEKKPIQLIHMVSPFELYLILICICICSLIFEVWFYLIISKRVKFAKIKSYRAKLPMIKFACGTFLFFLSNNITQVFKPDFIIGIGSRPQRPTSFFFKELKGFKEGSIDYISVLGLEKGKREFLHCFETSARQVASRFNYESINYRVVPKSAAFYDQTAKGVVVCGTNIDDNLRCKLSNIESSLNCRYNFIFVDKCHVHNGKTSVGYSKTLLPQDSSVVQM